MIQTEKAALEAVKQAVASPLLETTIAGASHVIINVSGDITLMDASIRVIVTTALADTDMSDALVRHNGLYICKVQVNKRRYVDQIRNALDTLL